MNTKALRQLIRVLEEQPKEVQVNLFRWWTDDAGSCPACWAASDSWFIERGFELGEKYHGARMPTFKGMTAFSAITEFFEIPQTLAFHLFHPEDYDVNRLYDKNAVIERIKAVLEEHSDAP